MKAAQLGPRIKTRSVRNTRSATTNGSLLPLLTASKSSCSRCNKNLTISVTMSTLFSELLCVRIIFCRSKCGPLHIHLSTTCSMHSISQGTSGANLTVVSTGRMWPCAIKLSPGIPSSVSWIATIVPGESGCVPTEAADAKVASEKLSAIC